MSESLHDAASHYDRVTAAWQLLLGGDFHYGLFERGEEDLATATHELTQRMIAAAAIPREAEVLDVGCGTGAQACHLAATLGARVMGITTSEVGVQSALARAAAAGLEDRVRFDRRDATDNGFADRSFDRVWVLESSHLIRDRDRLFAECARVLRPEGRLALCDIVLMRDLPLPEVVRLLEPLTLLRDVFGDARMERLEQYVGRATRHGLVVDRVEDLTVRTRPTFARWRDNARRHRDDVSRTIGDEGWRQFVAATEVLERFWDDGTLGYGLLAAAKPA